MFPERLSTLASLTEWENVLVRPPLHICVFMCQPFQILEQLADLHAILYDRYTKRACKTSSFFNFCHQ